METNTPLLIIGTYKSYKMYLRANGLREKNCRFISDAKKLMGFERGTKFVAVNAVTMTTEVLEECIRVAKYLGYQIEWAHV